jgi:hypothetical protein
MILRVRAGLSLAAAWFALAGGMATAEPHTGDATRADLTRWLDRLAASGVDVGTPQQWRYAFSASGTQRLEALSLDLVRGGYAVDTLTGSVAGGQLLVTRTELLSPAALERRNRELTALARKYGARYDSVDVGSVSRTR